MSNINDRFGSFRPFLRQATGVIHAGANLAQEAPLYDELDLEVVWIEALPRLIPLINKKIKKYSNQIILQGLLADKDEKIFNFHISDNHFSSSSLLPPEEHKEVWPDISFTESEALNSVTLDTLLNKNNLKPERYPILVMDIQGAELMALQGASNYLSRAQTIILEAPNFKSYHGCPTLKDLDLFLTKASFNRSITNNWELGEKTYYDALYTRI